jgi:hypothetical protein
MKTSSAKPHSRAMNVNSGSVEPPTAAERHDLRQSSNCGGDAPATDATRFLTDPNAMCFRLNSKSREKFRENCEKAEPFVPRETCQPED